ncbi:hypothetical protein GCM10023186_27610 [Hymenobacter koreensis]|uniref:Glycosyltransferase RgtA/B/C/D-like domain-containing protein n=2 Tax=Hymenobacter koreensis TaxID=1084523 RepID=A0ABP8J4D8_9BACT
MAVALFFGALLALGLGLHRDYGMSWDEVNNHLNGLVNLKYVAQRLLPASMAQNPSLNPAWVPALATYKDRDHGALFEMLVTVSGQVLGAHDSRAFYFWRHLCVFLVFMLGVWALYRLAWVRFANWRLALIAAGMLVLSPRLFAEAFYNGKDLVFMALYALAMYTLVELLRRPSWQRAILHAITTAAAIDLRAQGLQLLLLTAIGLALEAALAQRETGSLRPRWGWGWLFLLYLAAALAFAVAGWPYLWTAAWSDLAQASEGLRSYAWPHANLYFGRFVPANQLPWHYVFVWLSITTPLPYTLAALLGLAAGLRHLVRTGLGVLRTPAGRLDALLLLWLLGPLVFVLALRPSLYDGWRHLYFVYPAFLLWAGRGLHALWQATRQPAKGRWFALAVLVLMAAETVRTAVRMVQMHPYQNVYFSFLPAAVVEQQFERDYWGLAYRQGLEWIAAHDASPRIPVAAPFLTPVSNNIFVLPAAERERLQPVTRKSNNHRYFLTGYRWHPQSYADSVGREVYSIRAGGVKILSVFKRKAAADSVVGLEPKKARLINTSR